LAPSEAERYRLTLDAPRQEEGCTSPAVPSTASGKYGKEVRMKVRLVFVPPGGGEADYSLDFDLPSLPQPGDYISIWRSEKQGTEDFIVRRTWWNLEFPDSKLSRSASDQTHGVVKMIAVECEFAIGAYSSEDHKRACNRYGASELEASAF
jgi:hypothetical protein